MCKGRKETKEQFMLQVGIDCEVSQEIIIVPTENKLQNSRQEAPKVRGEPSRTFQSIARGRRGNQQGSSYKYHSGRHLEWLHADWPNLMLCSVLVSGGSLNI